MQQLECLQELGEMLGFGVSDAVGWMLTPLDWW